MALVAEVLTVAAAPGYLIEDTAAGARVWRASGGLDARSERPALMRADPDEAGMVCQLLARGWLHRAAPAQTRAGVHIGQSSGRRRCDVAAHALTVPTPVRQSLARWSALTAIPTQPDAAVPS